MAQQALKKRVITALIFGFVLICGIFLSEYSLVGLLVIILVVGNFELQQLLAEHTIFPSKLFTYLSNLLVLATCFYFGFLKTTQSDFKFDDLLLLGTLISLLFLALAIWELFRKKPKPFENVASALFAPLYLGLPISLLLLSSINHSESYQPWLVMFFFLFIWASDVAAYFFGRAFGKHKLFERHSPKKTIEGFIGGIAGSSLIGLAAYACLGIASLPVWIGIGMLLSIAGTLGDLFESMLKRQANMKDSGKLLPGHGGILDRFDSTFIAAPVYYLLLRFLV
jgi:phosphatidate cytidylyltransferase